VLLYDADASTPIEELERFWPHVGEAELVLGTRKAAGAVILKKAPELFAQADLIQKVKEPLPAEFKFLKPGQIIFCFLHLASQENRKLLEVLLESRVTAIGYETISVEGRLPILAPMSEIAGGLSAAYGAYLLSIKENSGGVPELTKKLEQIAQKYPTVDSARGAGSWVIFGGGVAGRKALELALKIKARVSVVETNPDRRRELAENPKIQALSPENDLLRVVSEADLMIGCAHSLGKKAVLVIHQDLLAQASGKKKKVMMDIAIDQGGNFPGARSTTYEDPVYRDEFGNLRFSVPNIPSFAGHTASRALSLATISYTRAMAMGLEPALKQYPELLAGINVRAGEIHIPAIK
jgi:alanine dehydrogenase